jgi:hypothetical protein
MARKTRRTDDVEAEVFEAPSPMVVETPDAGPALVDPSPYRGSAVEREPARDVPEVKIRSYRLEHSGRFMLRGNITQLSAGKIVDELNYDIASLLSQGAALIEQ